MSASSLRHDADDDDDEGKARELQTEVLLCAFETLGKTWPKTIQTQSKSQLQVLDTHTHRCRVLFNECVLCCRSVPE